MNIRKGTVLFILIFLSAFVWAQQGQILLKSTNKQAFYIAINDTLIDTIPQTKYSLISYSNKPIAIESFTDSLIHSGHQTLSFDVGKSQTFDVNIFGDQLRFLEATKNSLSKAVKGIVTDSLAYSQNVIKADAIRNQFLQLKYGDKAGCLPPISTTDFQYILETGKNIYFSKKRLKYFLETIPDLCFRVAQFNEIWTLFDFDEPKLQLANAINSNIFDLDNVDDFSPNFILESNQEKFESIIQTIKNN